jgi:hypothetical protein
MECSTNSLPFSLPKVPWALVKAMIVGEKALVSRPHPVDSPTRNATPWVRAAGCSQQGLSQESAALLVQTHDRWKERATELQRQYDALRLENTELQLRLENTEKHRLEVRSFVPSLGVGDPLQYN